MRKKTCFGSILARLSLLVLGLSIGNWPGIETSAQARSLLSFRSGVETVRSPDQRLQVEFTLSPKGEPLYRIQIEKTPLLSWSRLGLQLGEEPSLDQSFQLISSSSSTHDSTWEQVWGEERWIRNHYQELTIHLKQTADPTRSNAPPREMNLIFRVYNDGVAFRYEVPLQPGLSAFSILRELTEFQLVGNPQAWWIDAFDPADYEQHYQRLPVRGMKPSLTPLTIETGSHFVSIHEANLTDYAGMYLSTTNASEDADSVPLQVELFPWSDGIAVKTHAPMQSPWRTLQIADSPGGLVTSYLILNLNEPNRLKDTSWIQPQKYMGIWWGMHIGLYTWHSGPQHGATTARAKEYIRAARDFGIPGLLIEGWNLGWDGDWFSNGDLFDFLTPYPDFDLQEVVRFAQENGVEIIGHHETAGGVTNYERQMEDAYRLYQSLGIRRVKTGYVANRMDGKEWRHSQYMVRHHQRVTEMAARYQIALDIHEPIKDTGLRRTYPNIMTREGACGAEYDAWGGAKHNPPNHHTILPFTRSLSGPFDYTPGIFNLLQGKTEQDRIRTTLAKQLALYVTIYSPLHMAADRPEHYEGHPAFKFVQDVPTDWETTRVLNAEIGEYTTIVRKDRKSEDWYLGSVTNEKPRRMNLKLDFLKAHVTYQAELYLDRPNSHFLRNPLGYQIRKKSVTAADQIELDLAPGGGAAIRFAPIK